MSMHASPSDDPTRHSLLLGLHVTVHLAAHVLHGRLTTAAALFRSAGRDDVVHAEKQRGGLHVS